MNVSGEFTVNAPRDVVFKTLRDPSSFVRFVDGVSDLKEIDPTHYEAVFETKVAYLKFKFNVTVEVTRADEPSEIEAKIEGNAARRGRPADRQVDHPARRGRQRDQGHLFGRIDARRQARQHRPAGAALQGQGHGKDIRDAAARRVRGKPRTEDK